MLGHCGNGDLFLCAGFPSAVPLGRIACLYRTAVRGESRGFGAACWGLQTAKSAAQFSQKSAALFDIIAGLAAPLSGALEIRLGNFWIVCCFTVIQVPYLK